MTLGWWSIIRKLLGKLAIQIQCNLLNAGLVQGVEKCVWIPEKIIDWNGFRFDFHKGGLQILPHRIEKLLENLTQL
jgi:hypothetical protein